MDVSTRVANASDIEFARKAHHQAYKDVVTKQFGQFELEEQDNFFYDSWDTSTHKIIEYQGERAGYFCVTKDDNQIFLNTIAILPEFQGKGIGSKILKVLIEEAKEVSLPLKLQVLKHNKACELYLQMGFVIVSEHNGRYKMKYQN